MRIAFFLLPVVFVLWWLERCAEDNDAVCGEFEKWLSGATTAYPPTQPGKRE